jgi:hypothetical protein
VYMLWPIEPSELKLPVPGLKFEFRKIPPTCADCLFQFHSYAARTY